MHMVGVQRFHGSTILIGLRQELFGRASKRPGIWINIPECAPDKEFGKISVFLPGDVLILFRCYFFAYALVLLLSDFSICDSDPRLYLGFTLAGVAPVDKPLYLPPLSWPV